MYVQRQSHVCWVRTHSQVSGGKGGGIRGEYSVPRYSNLEVRVILQYGLLFTV